MNKVAIFFTILATWFISGFYMAFTLMKGERIIGYAPVWSAYFAPKEAPFHIALHIVFSFVVGTAIYVGYKKLKKYITSRSNATPKSGAL